jgi:phosphonate metabolism protein PhnN/1,5-bisphosphokinase (PRPP-forming)
MDGSGALVLVVGPSGAGKDTLIAAARSALDGDERFVFLRRVVTRPAMTALEDHESLSEAEFALRERNGAYALSWEAHGLRYGLPATLKDDLAAGRVVIANGSRAVLTRAGAVFPNLKVLMIDAAVDIRAERLAARGRESAGQIEARLSREVEMPVAGAVRIDNSGSLEEGVERVIAALRGFAAG